LFPIHSGTDNKKDDSSTIVSGPFKLEKWVRGRELVFVKNYSYWDASSVHLDKVSVQVLDDDVALKLFEKGEIEWTGAPMGTIPPDTLHFLKNQSKLEFSPAAGTYFFRVNITHPPFDNPKIRKAFSYALNREEIVHHVTQGNEKPAMGLIPPSIKGCIKPYFSDQNVAKAQMLFIQALQEMGMDRINFPVITISYAQDELYHKVAQAIQSQWREIFGIEVLLQSNEPKFFYHKVKKKDYQLAFGSWFADFRDPINFLDAFKLMWNGANNTGWEHPLYTALLDQSNVEFDHTKRYKLLHFAEYLLMEEMPIIPLFFATFSYAKKKELKGVYFSDTGYLDFKHAYIGTN
jgi:oligopeptide transport system substrate-binding protein